MNINLKPGRIVPHDHVEYLIARYGWWKIARACLSHGLRRGRNAIRPDDKPVTLGKPSMADYLPRDIGLPPDPPQVPGYWDLR